ncbi:hypothetical protein [Streptomyces fagopyri]
MAVKKCWPVNHACGHISQADLSDHPAGRRAGYARLLAERDCSVNCTILASLVAA